VGRRSFPVARCMASERRPLVRRVVIVAAAIAAVVFAVQGGEFSTFDLLRERRAVRRLAHDVDSLQRTVDSLRRYETAVRTDPAMQERLARENFGMVRGNKEILYRFADSTSASNRP
jgi:cell division protein FtsB